jgi:hypothetical protein
MADVTKVSLTLTGAEATSGTGDELLAAVPTSPITHVTLTASATPANAVVTWAWTKDDTPIANQTKATYDFDYTEQTAGGYVATATATSDSSTAKSNKVTLSTASSVATDDKKTAASGVVDVEIGEYDSAFAYLTLVVIVGLAILALFVLTHEVHLGLPSLTAKKPNTGTYAERLRAYAVVGVVCAGFFALAVGTWLAAMEVRGRLRRRTITLPATADHRGLAEDVSKVLDSASKLRSTIAVLVAGVALLLGALWAVGQTPDPTKPEPTTTTTKSSTTKPKPKPKPKPKTKTTTASNTSTPLPITAAST